MAYRNIFISSSAKLSLKNNQLVVNGGEYTFPLEDISTLMVENRRCTITAALMSACAAWGVAVYFCDEKHTPNGILTGYNVHSRKAGVLQAQMSAKQPLKKAMWQKIVAQKIINQAKVLSLLGLSGERELISLSGRVKSGDSDNAEAVAASKYFRYLFGQGFNRSAETPVNARLNYGYAIVRGRVCRSLVSYGLEPALGINHHSRLNRFNLADDIMEPFRPVVDLCVYQMEETDSDSLSVRDKQILYNLLNCDVVYKGQKHTLAYGIEKTVQTVQASFMGGKNVVELCRLTALRQHRYE